MARSPWTQEHVDFIEKQVRSDNEATAAIISTRMSKEYGYRITPAQVNTILRRMRTKDDPFFRAIPYRRPGRRAM